VGGLHQLKRGKTSSPLRLHGTIARDIGIGIVSGRLKPGQILTGEIDSSARLAVSRTAYREALRILAAKGLVESRPKVGTKVSEQKNWHLLDPDVVGWTFANEPDWVMLKNLFELRDIVESHAAALAAIRRSDAQLNRMRQALDATPNIQPTVPSPLEFPIPGDYGVYVIDDGKLKELEALPEQVPDKRIAVSTPVTQPSRTSLVNGRTKFVVYRRDLANNAPERVDVRVVAQVARALTFDPKGKPASASVSGAWNIRNITYGFRVRPLPGNAEMLLIQPENTEFVLPPGRYVLVLKNQGYDFTISGKVTDPSQCLERTEAANGIFYSECQKL